MEPSTGTRRTLVHFSVGSAPTTHGLYYKVEGHGGERRVSLHGKSLHILETFCCQCQMSVRLKSNKNELVRIGDALNGLFSVDCSFAYAEMFPLSKLLILVVASGDRIPAVALPAPTRVASSAARLVLITPSQGTRYNWCRWSNKELICLFSQHLHGTRQGTTSFDGNRPHEPANTGEQAAMPFRPSLLGINPIVRFYQSIRGPETRSAQPEQSEHQQQQTVDPVPCDMFTRILGPTDDANGTVDATNSTAASSRMDSTAMLDTTTSTETVTRGTSSFVVASTPGPSSQNGLWSTSSKFAAEPAIVIASSWVNAAVTPDATTSAETITPESSFSFVAATKPAPNSL